MEKTYMKYMNQGSGGSYKMKTTPNKTKEPKKWLGDGGKEEGAVTEQSAEYKKYFNSMLKKWNVKDVGDLSDEDKKKFFAEVDKGYKAKGETSADDKSNNEEYSLRKERTIPGLPMNPYRGGTYDKLAKLVSEATTNPFKKPEGTKRIGKYEYEYKTKPNKKSFPSSDWEGTKVQEWINSDEAEMLAEKWAKKVAIQHTGEHAGKSEAELKQEIAALRGKPGNKEKMGELLFALRAKQGWKKGEGATGLKKAAK